MSGANWAMASVACMQIHSKCGTCMQIHTCAVQCCNSGLTIWALNVYRQAIFCVRAKNMISYSEGTVSIQPMVLICTPVFER